MLLRTEKLVSKYFFKQVFIRNGFCQSKLNIEALQLKKQKAELSLEIYHLILQKPKNLDLKQKSLHDLIMEKINQKNISKDSITLDPQKNFVPDQIGQQTFKYHEEARRPFIDLFQNGFDINTKVFSQERIVQGQTLIDLQRKFTFHPTYFITSQIFLKLHTLFGLKEILTGHLGISKTVSVCLFWHLVEFINEYRFQDGVIVSQEMMRVPKIVYLSIDRKKNSPSYNVKKFIIDQCPEIKKKYKLTDGSEYDWKLSSIEDFYSKNFPKCIVIQVIDQINHAAQIGRIYKQQIEDIFNRRRKGEIIKIQDIQNQEVKFFFKVKEDIQFCVLQFHGFLGLSSMNIQHYLFKQIHMAIATNAQELPITWVKYQQKFFQNQSLIQMVDYYIFEMKQRIFKNLINTKVSQKDLREIKNICYKEIKKRVQKKQYFFFTPYNIRLHINKSFNVNKIELFDKPIQYLKEQVNKQFKILIDQATKNYKNLLLKHFKKNDLKDLKRVKLMLSIYKYLVFNLNNRQSKTNQISQIPLDILSFQKDQINQLIDKRLFQINEGTNAIKLMLPSSFMKQFARPCVKKELNIYAQVTLQFYQRYKNDNAQIGKLVEFQLISALSFGDIKFSFNLKNQISSNSSIEYQFDIKDEIYTFEHLQKTSKNSIQILKPFKNTIKYMREHNKKNAVLFPVQKYYQSKKTDQLFNINDVVKTSKLIDIALIENLIRNNTISVWLIDLTVSKSEIRPKIQDFISQFLKFSDKNVTVLPDIQKNLKVEINYLVFGPKNGIYHNHFSKTLENKFGDQITFKTQNQSNVFTVEKLQNSQSSLLKRVGYIDLGKDFDFNDRNQNNEKYIQALDKIFKKI